MGDTTISVVVAGEVLVPDAPDHEVIATASTGHAAVAHALIEVPDVLVVDVHLAEPDVLGVCRRVREWAPATRILAAGTTADDDGLLYASLLAGAAAAVIRAADGSVGTAALRATALGESVLRPRLAIRILHAIDTWASERADPLNPPPSLTETEREVLHRLGSGCSPATIGSDHGVTERLVNLHAGYAVAKLHRHVRDAETLSAYRG